MAVRRKRSRAPRAVPGTRLTVLGAVGGGELGAAAEEIADGARALAAPWSQQIPPNISVVVTGNTAIISCDVGPAYPNEVPGVRHPTFGHDPWRTNEHRPFLGPAADARAGAAMAKYAQKIDRLCREAGFS
jgi:hypothetical protein